MIIINHQTVCYKSLRSNLSQKIKIKRNFLETRTDHARFLQWRHSAVVWRLRKKQFKLFTKSRRVYLSIYFSKPPKFEKMGVGLCSVILHIKRSIYCNIRQIFWYLHKFRVSYVMTSQNIASCDAELCSTTMEIPSPLFANHPRTNSGKCLASSCTAESRDTLWHTRQDQHKHFPACGNRQRTRSLTWSNLQQPQLEAVCRVRA